MAWLAKVSLFVCLFVAVIGFGAPITASADELYKVTVTVNIENPNYFWQYPVLGKQLDRITISSFGKTVFIPSSTDTQKLELEVPQDYHLRLHINLQNGNSTVQSITYVSKEGIHRSDQNFTINLKAPDPQPAIISSLDFETARR